jgi:hypothetical protein
MKFLKQLCQENTTEVFNVLKSFGFRFNKKRKYAFRPGATQDAPMLVCHADTVANGGFGKHNYEQNGDQVNSIALDDRLGIACMLELIHNDSCLANCAMLVCDDEEIGNSSAKNFKEEGVNPNWLVELDRRGTDAVMYDYEHEILASMLELVGFEIGRGSFSDICHLESLGVRGFNIGVGYHREHSEACYADLADTRRQLSKLEDFYVRFSGLTLPYTAYDARSGDFYADDWATTDSGQYSSPWPKYEADAGLKDDINQLEIAMASGRLTYEAEEVYDRYGFDPETDFIEDVYNELTCN